MKITIQSKHMNEEDIRFLYTLLPHSCQRLPIHVAVIDDIHVAKEFLQNSSPAFWERVKQGHTVASYNFATNRIAIFAENILHDKYFFIRIAFSFFHEWRHAFQYHWLSEIFRYEWQRYMHDTSIAAYEEQWIEQDANHFAYQLLTINAKSVSSYIGFSDWNCSIQPPAPRHPLLMQEKGRKPKWRLFA